MLEGLSEEDFIRKVNRKGHLDVVQSSSIKSCEDIDETNLYRRNLSILYDNLSV
jgi:hypothetical protein